MRFEKKLDLTKVRGITVFTACDFCKENGRVPGGKYKHEGEVINCPVCEGNGAEQTIISIDDLKALIKMLAKDK